ncbi:MAG: sulfotransferase domain-containing protein [Nitrospirota bacterium]
MNSLSRTILAAGRKWRFQIRFATARFRTLPYFIIIGAMKCGTTSLFSSLSQHPRILKGYGGEIHFFNKHYAQGPEWYRAHFPLRKRMSTDRITGEATPQYLLNPLVPNRIREMIPRVKLIAILRNPTERAISHYFHEVRKKRETLPILKALQAEEQRLEKILRENDFTNPVYFHASYKKRGMYSEQLQRFIRYFPREQILVLSSEEFFSNPGDVLRQVFRFLEVNENFSVKDLTPRNVGWNRKEVDPEVYEYLNDYFSLPNQELYQLLGRDFHW